jgi:lipid-A-disaccharide synthase
LALLPGSRKKIFLRLAPAMLGAAELLLSDVPDLLVAVALAPSLPRSLADEVFQKFPNEFLKRVIIYEGRSKDVLNAATASLLASGTAVTEGTVLGAPMVVAYKTSPLSFFLAKLLVKVPFISVSNIIANDMIIPEFLQKEASPENLKNALSPYFTDPEASQRAREGLSKIKASLGGPGASEKTVRILLEELEKAGCVDENRIPEKTPEKLSLPQEKTLEDHLKEGPAGKGEEA